MKKFFTLLAATMLSVVGFAAAGPNSGNVQNIPTTADNPFDCSAVIFDQVTYDANWNGNNIDYIGKHDVVSFNINNTKEAAYKITFKYSTILDGVTVDFVIKNASDQEVFKSTINTPSTSGGENNWSNYVDAESEVTPVLPVGSYKFFIYYGEGTWQGGENPFACNINNIAFIEQAGAAATADPIVIDLSRVIPSGPNGHYAEDMQKLDYFCYGETATLPFEVTTASAYNLAIDYATIISHFGATFTIKNSADAAVWQEVIELDHTTANEGDNDWTIVKTVNATTNTPVLEPGNYVLFIEYNVQGTWEGNPHQFTANIHKLVLNAVAGGTPSNVPAVFLHGENFDKANSTATLYKFTDTDFALQMDNRDPSRTPCNWTDPNGVAYTDGINFQNRHPGSVIVPAGKKVYAIAIGGVSQSDAGNLCYLRTVDVDNVNIFTEAIGESVTDNTVINNAKYIILPDGNAPQFALIDLTAAPAASSIQVVFDGNNQEDVWFKLYTTEEDANAVLGKGGSQAGGAKVIYSWIGGEDGATEVGGQAVASDGESVNYANAGNWTIRINKKKANIETENVTITLDEALAEGDEIAITGYRNKDDNEANGTLYMLFETGASIDEGDEVVWNNIHPDHGQQPNTNTYTVAAEAAGSKTIKIARSKASTNVFITEIKITRGGSTGVKAIETVVERPANNIIYNLRGQRVDASYKGIVIVNGKKFFQK